MNTVIIGQGAIGLLCYHQFSCLYSNLNKNHSISLWPSKATSLTHYTFKEINKKSIKIPLTIADEQALARAEVIVICVKSFQVANALKAIRHLIADNAMIVLTHNGLGTLEEISYLLKPSQCLLTLLLTQGAKKVTDYHVEHTGMGDSDLGIVSGKLNPVKQEQLLAYFQQGLKQINWQTNINQAQWRKLAINCVINPLTAIENIDNGDITQPIFQKKVKIIIAEIVDVAEKEGVFLKKEYLLTLINKVAENTAKNSSSMRVDILEKRTTEIDYINGYIHRLGIKHQLATPINTQLWLAVKALNN
jgi:2-dehydropantoate 2-reductase